MTPAIALSPRVIWLLPALRQLRQSQALAYMNGGPAALTQIQNQVTARIEALYPDGVVAILQQYEGFRPNPRQFIFLIEVVGNDESARYIVKLDTPEELQRELNAWNSCRPRGLHNDPVLMMLTRLEREGRLDGLQYIDAQQFIGGTSVYLEEAFVDAVRFGNPAPSSLAEAFSTLYGRLAYLFYPTSIAENPGEAAFILDIPRLAPSLGSWQQVRSTPCLVREEVNTLANQQPGCFRDPVVYLTSVRDRCTWRGCPHPDTRHRPEHPASLSTSQALREITVPRMLRGCAHGDLHGRNVLVGIAHGRARWPAVYDYEAMSPRTWIAWDFVKMETELKMRCYPHLFENEQAHAFINAIQRFEIELAEQTERCYNGATWPAVDDQHGAPRERLRSLLLVLRRLAALHLGRERGRTREWLDEWYFAQACYGVHAGRFDNLERPHLIGAYIAAGVATARYLYYRESRIDTLLLTLSAPGQTS